MSLIFMSSNWIKRHFTTFAVFPASSSFSPIRGTLTLSIIVTQQTHVQVTTFQLRIRLVSTGVRWRLRRFRLALKPFAKLNTKGRLGRYAFVRTRWDYLFISSRLILKVSAMEPSVNSAHVTWRQVQDERLLFVRTKTGATKGKRPSVVGPSRAGNLEDILILPGMNWNRGLTRRLGAVPGRLYWIPGRL